MTTPPLLRPEHGIVPRAPRYEVDIVADITGPTVESFSSPVKNISSSGMLLAESGELQVGDVLYAKLPGRAAILCVVARLKRDGGAGVKFQARALSDGFWK